MLQEAKIEVVRIHRFDNGGPIKAFCDLQFGDGYVVKGFKLVEGNEGSFIGMPSEVGKNGKWYNTFQPLTDETKERIQKAIVTAYEE